MLNWYDKLVVKLGFTFTSFWSWWDSADSGCPLVGLLMLLTRAAGHWRLDETRQVDHPEFWHQWQHVDYHQQWDYPLAKCGWYLQVVLCCLVSMPPGPRVFTRRACEKRWQSFNFYHMCEPKLSTLLMSFWLEIAPEGIPKKLGIFLKSLFPA